MWLIITLLWMKRGKRWVVSSAKKTGHRSIHCYQEMQKKKLRNGINWGTEFGWKAAVNSFSVQMDKYWLKPVANTVPEGTPWSTQGFSNKASPKCHGNHWRWFPNTWKFVYGNFQTCGNRMYLGWVWIMTYKKIFQIILKVEGGEKHRGSSAFAHFVILIFEPLKQ